MKKHLAIFKGSAGKDILSGKKTVESRFSRVKNPPFGVISTGDLVYIKPSGTDIIGQFRVNKVFFFDHFSPEDLNDLKTRFTKELNVDEDYWRKVENARFATLIFIGDCIHFITSPIKIPKKDLRGWVVLD